MAERIPCINPRCRRTADPAKMPGATSMICNRCFKMLPASLRRRHKQWWSRDRRLERLSQRKALQVREQQLDRVRELHNRAGDRIWSAIAQCFRPSSTEKPRGLDAFLEEMGL